MPVRRAALLACTLATLTGVVGCASTQLRPIENGAHFQPDADERALWEEAGALDAALAKSDAVYDDPALQAYVDGVVARLQPHLRLVGVPLRVRVLEDPYLNAFALPNGSVYVHSGLLVQLDNEAQLATVLGHELTHFAERHAMEARHSYENRRTVAAVVFGVLAVAAAGASGNAGAARAMLDLGEALSPTLVDAQMSGYSRDLEREADARGFAIVTAAGYDARETPKPFVRLQAESREANIAEPYFFGSHPRLAERIESYEALAAAQPAGGAGRVAADELNAAIADLLLVNAKMDIDMGRTARACGAIDRHLAGRPDNAAAVFLLGEAHRRAGQDEQARADYERAVALDPAAPAPQRELGLLHRTAGRRDDARAAFARYLALAPGAADRPIVEMYMTEEAP